MALLRGKVVVLVGCVCLVPVNTASRPVCGCPMIRHANPLIRTRARRLARGPDDSHVGPMICVWAAPPTCMSRGLRAYRGVDAHTQGLTCERTMWLSGRYHPGQAPDNAREQPIPPRTAHNADHFATSSPLSAFFTEVVCDVGATPPRTSAAPAANRGNFATRASDTPTTRR